MKPFTQVEITLPERLTLDEQGALKQLLRDAVGEFMSAREPAEKYVSRRYSDHSATWRERKLAEVQARLGLAQKLRRAIDEMKVTDDTDIDIE